MARITSRTETAYATGTSYTVTLGSHVTGDLLMVCLSNDGGATTIAGDAATVTAGWVLVGTQAASAGTRQVWFWVIATSGAMANPVFTVATQGTSATCLVIKEAHATPIGGNMRSDWTTANTAASNTVAYSSAGGTTVITPASDSLLLYSWCCDGSGRYMRTKLNDLICDSRRAYTGVVADTISHIIGHTQLVSASCPDVTMYADVATEGGNGWVIEIKNVASGTLQKQARATVDETGTASNWYGSLGAQHSAVTWNKPSTFVAAAGGAQTVTINGVAITLSDTTLGTISTSAITQDSPWGSPSTIPNGDNANVLAGAWHTITSSNLDGKVFSFQWDMSVTSVSGRINTEGVVVGFASSDGNYAFYQVSTKAIGWLASQVRTAIIDLNNATLIASAGTIDWTAVVRIAYFWHRASGSATADNLEIKNACLLTSAAITGGSATDPANFQVAANDLTSWGHKNICDLQASAQVVAKFPLQIGDDTNYTYFDSSASSLEFPKAFSATQKDWNVNANRIGLTVLAKDGDTVTLAAGVVASETAQALTISASSAAQADATYSFVGESLVGLTPTDSKGLSWSNTTFKSGGTVTIAGGGDLTNCTISKTTSTDAALSVTANGTVITSSTIVVGDVTGQTTDYFAKFGASVTAATLNTTTLTGSPAVDKFYSALASGTLTITVDGLGTSLAASDVTFVGGSSATAVIAAPAVYQKVIVSGFTAGSRIQIYDTTNSIELFNGTASAGDTVVSGTTATWTDPVAAAGNRAIRVRVAYVSGATAKMWQQNTGLTCGTSSTTNSITYPITQVADTTYDTNAVSMDGTIFAACGITFTDAATDLVNINIAADTVALKTIYAAFAWWLFTALGIDDDVAYIDAPNTANYIMTSMKIRNTSTDPLKITGGYFYDTTGSVENCVDITSPGNIYPMPEHVVPYQTTGTYAITGDIADIPTAAEITAAVVADPKTLTVGKFLGLK